MQYQQDFEERKAQHKANLQGKSAAAIFEIAGAFPGGSRDAPFAPIDPALHAAAVEMVEEAGFQSEFREYMRQG